MSYDQTIGHAITCVRKKLETAGEENAHVCAELIISFVSGIDRSVLPLYLDKRINAHDLETLHALADRRVLGEPVQYIIGQAPFRYLTLQVRPGVFIPRPETEILVDKALSMLPVFQDTESPLRVADIGTGSGCIACALAYERPDVEIYATDISSFAADVAKENISKLGLEDRISVFVCDIGSSIINNFRGTFDLIVSNPPYVPSAVLATLSEEIRLFEPLIALDGGSDGLDFFSRLLSFSRFALRPGGAFAIELHEDCLDSASAMAKKAGFCDVSITPDLCAKPRILSGKLEM